MSDEVRSLYSRLCADGPEDYEVWIDAHIPVNTGIETWGAFIDLLMMDAMNALVDQAHHSRTDFDRAVDFLVAVMNCQRIPSNTGIKWLGAYAMAAERRGAPIGHPEITPDAIGRRIFRCLLTPQSGEVVLGAQLPAEDAIFDQRYDWPPADIVRKLRAVKPELAWAKPRLKDPTLALMAEEWWEVIRDCG